MTGLGEAMRCGGGAPRLRCWGGWVLVASIGVFLIMAVEGVFTPSRLAAGPSVLGRFRLSYYYLVKERPLASGMGGTRWPLFAPSCNRVLAYTDRAFHHRLSLEGTGLLRDGRLVNFEERCSCAWPGHGGSRICYTILNRRLFPWGRGARLAGDFLPLVPFRSVAVDPALIPIGTRLFLPELRGKRRPDGGLMDGCFRAEDVGRMIQGRRVDLFTGTAGWADWLRRTYRLTTVTVQLGAGACGG